jgi:hypothetical protein
MKPENIKGINTRNAAQFNPKFSNPNFIALCFKDRSSLLLPRRTNAVPIDIPIRSVHINVSKGLVWIPDWITPEK